jgi:hypothetical protein
VNHPFQVPGRAAGTWNTTSSAQDRRGEKKMDSQGNAQDRDVWGNSPQDVQGNIIGTDVQGNAQHDVQGNYVEHSSGWGGSDTGSVGDATGGDGGGLTESFFDFLGGLFGG